MIRGGTNNLSKPRFADHMIASLRRGGPQALYGIPVGSLFIYTLSPEIAEGEPVPALLSHVSISIALARHVSLKLVLNPLVQIVLPAHHSRLPRGCCL